MTQEYVDSRDDQLVDSILFDRDYDVLTSNHVLTTMF